MKARTDADRRLKLIYLCDQCGAGILAGMKHCPDCQRAVSDIAEAVKAVEEKERNQGRFIA